MSKHRSNKKAKSQRNSSSSKKASVSVQASPTPAQAINPRGQSMTNPGTFTTQITMYSDWHIGTGAGRPGDVDRLVQRDQDGLPYIPAKTLTGIWRDACETVAWGLDNGEPGLWGAWVTYLFGDQPALEKEAVLEAPQPAAVSIRGAYLPRELKDAIATKLPADQTRLKEAITFVKPGISIDSKTGCAKEDFLRFEEMVRADTVLTADCQLHLEGPGGLLNEDQQKAALALLVAGSCFIERIGGKRRRGAGHCKVRLLGIDTNQHLDWLAKHLQPATPPSIVDLAKGCKPESETSINWHQYVVGQNSAWVAVPLKITAQSPLVITKRTVGNIVETLDYIPGTHLLRLIVCKLKPLGVDLSGAIACGDLLVTNATLRVEGQRGRPVPYALFGEKLGGGLEKGEKVYNRFAEPEADDQLKAERQGYIGATPKNSLPAFATVKTGIETHNIIEDNVQCPTRDVGGVYSYEAIVPGTVFQAELRLPTLLADQLTAKDSQWEQKLAGTDRLGQSKKDDYGRVHIEVLSPAPVSELPILENGQLTLWLLSDLLLRDQRLRPTADLEVLIQQLQTQLGVSLQLRHQAASDNNSLLSLMARQTRLESWQVRWGLPRPSLAGLAAGSCFVFEVNGNLDAAKLAQLEVTGIGERRAEGYGQVCFNDRLLTTPTSQLTARVNDVQALQSSAAKGLLNRETTEKLLKYARVIEEAAARQVIRQTALRIAANPDDRKNVLELNKDKPTMSQLGALRSIINRLQEPEQTEQTTGVMGWLQHLRQTPNRKDKWPPRSLQQIEDLVCNPETIWQLLRDPGMDIDPIRLTLIEHGDSALKRRLWAEAVQTLVDACIRTHKRGSENANQEGQ